MNTMDAVRCYAYSCYSYDDRFHNVLVCDSDCMWWRIKDEFAASKYCQALTRNTQIAYIHSWSLLSSLYFSLSIVVAYGLIEMPQEAQLMLRQLALQ